jgi:hypothetical protein
MPEVRLLLCSCSKHGAHESTYSKLPCPQQRQVDCQRGVLSTPRDTQHSCVAATRHKPPLPT